MRHERYIFQNAGHFNDKWCCQHTHDDMGRVTGGIIVKLQDPMKCRLCLYTLSFVMDWLGLQWAGKQQQFIFGITTRGFVRDTSYKVKWEVPLLDCSGVTSLFSVSLTLGSQWDQEASPCCSEHLKASVSRAAIDLLSCTGMWRLSVSWLVLALRDSVERSD